MTDHPGHLDEGTIHAWLDGALAPDESARVEAHAASCVSCGEMVAEARGLVAASSRILASLDDVPAGVIPGTDAGRDQLAALRARRSATARRWWRDPRVVAAASVVFMAGTFGLYWNANRAATSEAMFDSTAAVDVGQRAATAPVEQQASGAAADAVIRQEAAGTAPAERVATSRRVDSLSVSMAPPPAVPAPAVVNEAMRRADVPTAKVGEAGRATATDSVAAQRAELAPPLAFEALRDSSRVMAADARARNMAASSAVMGAGLRLARSPDNGMCYALRLLPAADERSIGIPDTVRLLTEPSPVRSDPSWFLAQSVAPRSSIPMFWRPVDSVTVELRRSLASDSSAIRFNRNGNAPDVSRSRNVLGVLALAVECR